MTLVETQHNARGARRDASPMGPIFNEPDATLTPVSRMQALGATSPAARNQVEHLLRLATRGLGRMRTPAGVAHTVRLVGAGARRSIEPEGDNLRYAAITALGAAQLDMDAQRHCLDGISAATLAHFAAARAENADDIGAVALAAWALVEVANRHPAPLFDRLAARLKSSAPLETVSCAWILTAGLAAQPQFETDELVSLAAQRLMESQSAAGMFPHQTPRSANGGLRGNVGCFADQVYPIQALARLSVARHDPAALAAAEACAERICDAQGSAGQWWWHYDLRDGSIVEGYPVYSVHQHAMGPMALLDLWEAGGTGYWREIVTGLAWLDRHPEVTASVVADQEAVVWRKVARREPNKATRAISAATTALRPGLHLPGLDTIFPPTQIDYECRPYEFGWMLYAWLSGRKEETQASPLAAREEPV